MGKITFLELVNIHSLKRMAENIYDASGVPISIIGSDGTVYIKAGWQDICTKYHRKHPETCRHCIISSQYINHHLNESRYAEYRCLNNMREIAVPIVIAGNHVATVLLGQFFYEDEGIDIDFFRKQANKFEFDEEGYLESLQRVPRISRKKIRSIVDYYLALVVTLAESGLRRLGYKNSQGELMRSQKYLSTIYNSVNDGIFIHDFDGKIRDANKTTVTMFGYSKKELINMNIKELISEQSLIKGEEIIRKLKEVRDYNPLIIEIICKGKNNREFWGEVNIRPIKLDKNEEIIVTIRDITYRKLNEFALQKEAAEIENLRTEFFANISHELKTPLNIILGAIQVTKMVIEDKEKPINREKILANLSIEKQNCFRLLRLINNLIDSTKLDSGYFDLNRVNCNIISVVEEITLSVAQYINHNNLNLIFDTEIEEKIIACDLDKIERIMLNLLSNAVKFTPDGGSIFVNILDGEEYVTIIVEDTGIGIPSEKLNIIFDRFRQVDKSFTRNHEGSGIGLSIVKSLVEMQEGSVAVESEYGRGAKFIVKLPVKIIDDGEETMLPVDCTMQTPAEKIRMEFSDM